MRMRRMLGLALAAATLSGTGAVGAIGAIGAVSAQAATSPNMTRQECTDAGGQVQARPYDGYYCALPDGSTQPVT
ncbi:hypothetical protein OV450_3868 [Actinobacteria bacterium OV450]|nr:hypothetical protein OV450_3868 [Actinobacteria bacterium OV450]